MTLKFKEAHAKMSSMTTDDSVLENFDMYQKKVLDILKDSSSLQYQNTELSEEVAEISRNKDMIEKTLLQKQADLDQLSNLVLQNVMESVELLKTLQQDVLDKKKQSEIQYELDICMSCKRSLERDCMLQKNENQRLSCLNNQLSQELKTLKLHRSSGH
jgi:hypothetical protein